jgi:hypothetical protein
VFVGFDDEVDVESIFIPPIRAFGTRVGLAPPGDDALVVANCAVCGYRHRAFLHFAAGAGVLKTPASVAAPNLRNSSSAGQRNRSNEFLEKDHRGGRGDGNIAGGADLDLDFVVITTPPPRRP